MDFYCFRWDKTDVKNAVQKIKTVSRQESESILSRKLRWLRHQSQLTLQQLSEKSGISVSTLSKIEKGQLSPTYEKIAALARGLGIQVGELFYEENDEAPRGRLTVTRSGMAMTHLTEQYDYRLLCADLAQKQFVPLLTTVKAKNIREFPRLLKHDGEEFVYVLQGSITVHTDFYQPVELNPGDCCYFDSSMGHACVAGEVDALILWVCSNPELR